jgi:FtsP/CotA-like multicopper oxidase with cupredoxin domain
MAFAAALTLTLSAGTAFAVACPPGQTPAFPGSGDCILDPTSIPQYVIPLVIPPVMNNNGTADHYGIAVRQFQQQILPGGIWELFDPDDDHANFPPTTVWSYGPAADPTPAVAPDPNSQFNYPAYTVETLSNPGNVEANRVKVRWINDLVDPQTGRFLPHLLPIDQTLHWANPPMQCIEGPSKTDCRGFSPHRYMGPVPIVTHVHGSHVEAHSDGHPEAWWLPDATNIPQSYATEGTTFDDAEGQPRGQNSGYADFEYRNDQPATTLWYHDHTLGMTRSNVYAGPAGFWLVRGGANDMVDDTSTGTSWDGVLPGPAPAPGESVVTVNFPSTFPGGLAGEREKYREIPIVVQDRSFKADGSLFYPATRAFFEGVAPKDLKVSFIPNPKSDISPIWNPEAFFTVMVVNGVAWPQLEVAQALYRFRFLNGCNSRFLWLKFSDPAVQVYQIGAEQGFLPAPVHMNPLNLDGGVNDGKAQLLIALAERADVIVDFRELDDGTTVELLNIGPDEPFGGGIPGVDFPAADPSTTGKVMKFVVNSDLNGASDTDPGGSNEATDPTNLALGFEGDLTGTIAQTRDLSLNEAVSDKICVKITFLDDGTIDQIIQINSVKPDNFEVDCATAGGEPFGPREALLGIVEETGGDKTPLPLMWSDPMGTTKTVRLQNGTDIEVTVTENPTQDTIEQWDIFNLTADAHPIHLHLVRFQVVNRQGLTLDTAGEVVVPITLDGASRPPEAWEEGYKDTVIAFPGEVTRVKALFDIAGLYVWHCHIVEHEDNEMMRPYVVSAAP